MLTDNKQFRVSYIPLAFLEGDGMLSERYEQRLQTFSIDSTIFITSDWLKTSHLAWTTAEPSHILVETKHQSLERDDSIMPLSFVNSSRTLKTAKALIAQHAFRHQERTQSSKA
jgi:hypothetical protein